MLSLSDLRGGDENRFSEIIDGSPLVADLLQEFVYKVYRFYRMVELKAVYIPYGIREFSSHKRAVGWGWLEWQVKWPCGDEVVFGWGAAGEEVFEEAHD